MSQKKNIDNLKEGYDDNLGIKQRFSTSFSLTELDRIREQEKDGPLLKPKKDPVPPHNRDALKPAVVPEEKKVVRDEPIAPTVSIRLALDPGPHLGLVGAKYIAPEPRSLKKAKEENRKKEEAAWDKCEYEVIRVDSPIITDNIMNIQKVESPMVGQAKVPPDVPSYERPSAMLFPEQTSSYLRKNEVKSGIFLNEKIAPEESKEIDDANPPRGKKKKRPPPEAIAEEVEKEMKLYDEGEEGHERRRIRNVMYEDRSTHVSDNIILGQVGVALSGASSATSMLVKDQLYDDISWCDIPAVSKLVQTLRDAHCPQKKKRKFKKGALENHSFTKLKQKVLEDFCYKSISGSIHQGDLAFSKVSRNWQGICMPIAAFCYAELVKPCCWLTRNIDEIVELGNLLYLESVADLHIHRERKDLTVYEVQKHVVLREKKVKYEISEPEVKGLVRSMDKRITNLSCGLRIFFLKYKACLFRTENNSYLICKPKKRLFYLFDATPRKNNLYQDPNGTAVLARVQKLTAVASILLERTHLGNSPFSMCQLKIVQVMGKDEKDVPPYVVEDNTYNVLSDKQAVVQGSFDLGDICFCFSRNKQALPMTLIALAYSRISTPNVWHRKTIDKIMVIGDQLYNLCTEHDSCPDVALESLPAVFTVGPYIIETHLYPHIYADCMYKKGECRFGECLRLFFEKNASVIAQIGRSYLAIWQQRGTYYCFDPYTRNKEGLKCRVGTACVSMNRDVDVLAETVAQNFQDRDAIFYLHALKVLKIRRDPELSRYYPKYLTLHDVPLEVFKKHKLLKSILKAVDRPITADFTHHALKKLLVGAEPDPSIYEVASNVISVGMFSFPQCLEAKILKLPEAMRREANLGEGDDEVIDLDSASLSDTQIPQKRKMPDDEEEVPIDDLLAYELTQEEKEMEENPEEGGAAIRLGVEGVEEGGVASTVSKFGVAASQVTSGELEPCYAIHPMNTDLSYCYKFLPANELGVKEPKDRVLYIDEEDQENEMKKLYAFKEVEVCQIVRARTNAIEVCKESDGGNPNLQAPYMCIMAGAFAIEVPLHRWQRRTIDYVLKGGSALYGEHKEAFNHIDEFKFQFLENKVSGTVDVIFNTYIDDGLYETFSGKLALEKFLGYHVFNKGDCGIVVLPHYACAVFYHRYLFYLFEPFNCDKEGNVLGNDAGGKSCLMRFKTLDALIERLVNNLSKREQENDKSGLDFRMFTLAKPMLEVEASVGEGEKEVVTEEEKQVEELQRPHNFVTLPDGSQLIRGKSRLQDYGAEAGFIAPYICVMASAVAEKFGIRTWSGDIVDFVLSAGFQLYQKAKYRFSQLAKLVIPKVSLGKSDFKIEMQYIFDAPMKMPLMKHSLKMVLKAGREWALLTTDDYACAVFQRNGLIYLFEAFPCNELGMGTAHGGFAAVSRFRNYDDLCIRILFNKREREKEEKVEHTRFALSVVKASRMVPDRPEPTKYPKIKERKGDEEEEEAEEEEEEGEEGEDKPKKSGEEKEEEGVNRVSEDMIEKDIPMMVGYQEMYRVHIIEGTRKMAVPKDTNTLGEDYFDCVVACLTATTKPVDKWDTKVLDKVLDIGGEIFDHADDLSISRKRTIKNILIGKYFFDVILKTITISDYQNNKNFPRAFKYVSQKRKFSMVQFAQGSYIIYLDRDTGNVHAFNPYGFKTKNKKKENVDVNACWIKFRNMKNFMRFLKTTNDLNKFTFYSLNVSNVTKAPRNYVITHQIQQYIRMKQLRGEAYGKPFHEHQSWTDIHHNPWARINDEAACGNKRSPDNKWYYWDVEYPNDLFSLMGTIHQSSREFRSKTRGKQGLANAVAAIAMTGIYTLNEWNSEVVDSVVRSGDKYLQECAEDIDDSNYELAMKDLKPSLKIYPFSCNVAHQPAIIGTLFLMDSKKYNLYKALRRFFDEYHYRSGVIIATRNTVKRIVAFGKWQAGEYYMFDAQAFGPPMFAERRGTAYILRCTTLARLVHVLTLTLRGGEFFIYEVLCNNYMPMSDEDQDNEDGAGEKDAKNKKKQ